MRKRLLLVMVFVLAIALVLPGTALARSWTKSPTHPLIKGGVHTKAGFIRLMTSNTRERQAMKSVLRADGYPDWVFDAAVKQAQLGHVYSTSLPRNTYIGAMAFGPKRTTIWKYTWWRGKGRLPYYYVNVAEPAPVNDTRVGAQAIDVQVRQYKVCIAKTCANPFVVSRMVSAYPLGVLKVDQFDDSVQWQITGNVGWVPVDTSTEKGFKVIGYFPAGTEIDLTETPQQGWTALDPASGIYSLRMPASFLNLTWHNSEDNPG